MSFDSPPIVPKKDKAEKQSDSVEDSSKSPKEKGDAYESKVKKLQEKLNDAQKKVEDTLIAGFQNYVRKQSGNENYKLSPSDVEQIKKLVVVTNNGDLTINKSRNIKLSSFDKSINVNEVSAGNPKLKSAIASVKNGYDKISAKLQGVKNPQLSFLEKIARSFGVDTSRWVINQPMKPMKPLNIEKRFKKFADDTKPSDEKSK